MKNRNNKKQARITICILITQLAATQSYAQTTPWAERTSQSGTIIRQSRR